MAIADTPNDAPRLWIPLLGRVILALAAVGLVPFLVSAYQVRAGRDAMIAQVQTTHKISVLATANRVESHVQLLMSLADAAARNPALDEPTSIAAEEVLAGILQARSDVVAAGVYVDRADAERRTRPVPEVIRVARRSDFRNAIDVALKEIDARNLAVIAAGGEDWLRVRTAKPGSDLFVVLLARLTPLMPTLRASEIGDEVELALADRSGAIILGDFADIASVSSAVLGSAGRTSSGVDLYDLDDGQELIAAHALVSDTPWFVISRQPLRVAARAAIAQRDLARGAFFLVLGVTGLVALWAQRGIILPIRKLISAQQRLAGLEGTAVAGGEIQQLEHAFAQLEANVNDRAALNKVFLDRYQVIEVLGVGAMGTVFRGWDPRLERPVALKTVKIDGAGTSSFGSRGDLAAQLVKEALALAQINHPNIVTVFDVQSHGAQAFLAMELVEGISLERYLWQEKRLPMPQVVALGMAVLAALRAAHRQSIVHQDIKPANILLGEDGAIKVTDFGISELLTNASERRGVICGTPGYLAPEALEGGGFTVACDLFAAGIVLYQCLTGRRPFEGPNPRAVLMATVSEEVTPPTVLRPETPSKIESFVLALTAKRPEDRPKDATAALALLEQAARETMPQWTPAPFPMKTEKGPSHVPIRYPTTLVPTRLVEPRST